MDDLIQRMHDNPTLTGILAGCLLVAMVVTIWLILSNLFGNTEPCSPIELELQLPQDGSGTSPPSKIFNWLGCYACGCRIRTSGPVPLDVCPEHQKGLVKFSAETEAPSAVATSDLFAQMKLVEEMIKDLKKQADQPPVVIDSASLAADVQAALTPKATYVGAPACFLLEQAAQHVTKAFNTVGCFLVGSALTRPNWRDVDVRLMLTDEEFEKLFPGTKARHYEHNAKWLLLTTSISLWMTKFTGLPIDFQIQPMTHANERHKGRRSAIGLTISHQPTERQ